MSDNSKELYEDLNRVAQEKFLGNKGANLSIDTKGKVLGDRILFIHKKDGKIVYLQMFGFYNPEDIGTFHIYEDQIIDGESLEF